MRVIWSHAVAHTADGLESAGTRLSTLLREIQDTNSPAVGRWTVGETAAHVAGGPLYFHQRAWGQEEVIRLEDVDAENDRFLAEDPERDPRVLADRFDEGLRTLMQRARCVPDDPIVEPFTGIRVPFSAVLGLELAEILVHGYDIARGSGQPWRIEREEARRALEGLLPFMPFALDPERARGLRLQVDLRMRGMQPQQIEVAHERLTVRQGPDGRADCHISVEPATYLLLAFGRIRPWSAMLRGRLVVWGRRPWLAGTLPSLLNA